MNNDFSLTAYTNVLGDHDKVRVLHTIPSVAESWERSVALQGGDWMGKFRLSGLPFQELIEIFNTWLGYDIQESPGGEGWGGMVYEMALYHNLIRRVSLEPMSNSVQAEYEQLVSNPGFEDTAGAGTFDDWTEVIGGTDTITDEGTLFARGAHAAKLTYGNNGVTYIRQNVAVTANTAYKVSFYSRGDGTREGRYKIYNATAAADIVAVTATGNITDKYRQVSADIVTPAGCVSLGIWLYVPTAAGSAYYDDVRIDEMLDGSPVTRLTTAVESIASQNQYGIKQILCGKYYSLEDANAAAATYLALHAWPQVEREEGQAGDEPYLEVTVVGYIFTSKWQLIASQNYGASALPHVHLAVILAGWQYVSSLALWPGSVFLVTLNDEIKTIRDGINYVIAAGSGADTIPRLAMAHNRRVVFEEISNTPVYHFRGGRFFEVGSLRTAVTGRHLSPDVVRDMDYPVSGSAQDSWFLDQRDFLLDEISVAADGSLRWGIAEV